MTPKTLLMSAVKGIFADVTSGNTCTISTPQRISRTGVAGSIPISTTIESGMGKSYTPASSNSTGTMVTGTRIYSRDTAPPVASTWARILTIYGNLLPYIRESPLNWKLPLINNSPIIWLRLPFSPRYSVTKYPKVPAEISPRAVRWTLWQILSISQHHNSWVWG